MKNDAINVGNVERSLTELAYEPRAATGRARSWLSRISLVLLLALTVASAVGVAAGDFRTHVSLLGFEGILFERFQRSDTVSLGFETYEGDLILQLGYSDWVPPDSTRYPPAVMAEINTSLPRVVAMPVDMRGRAARLRVSRFRGSNSVTESVLVGVDFAVLAIGFGTAAMWLGWRMRRSRRAARAAG